MEFVASKERQENHLHVLLIATGSVATIKVPLIVQKLLTYDKVKVEVVATDAALKFISPDQIEAVGSRVWTDSGDWSTWKKVGDPILHIELRRWADVVLVAPCSANTLAKIASGLCDNLAVCIVINYIYHPNWYQTCVLRALAPSTPTFVFPAMNTHMYEHPLTARHLDTVRDIIGYTVVGPVGKALACGDIGVGAMTEWSDIVQLVVSRWSLSLKELSEGLVTPVPAVVVEPSAGQNQSQIDLSAGIPPLEEIARDYPAIDLAALKRHPALQKRYDTWIQQVKMIHGSVVNYLVNIRLGWGPTASRPASPGSHTEPTYADDGSLDPPESAPVRPLTPSTNNGKKWFTADIAEPLVKILPNDWPYSVPSEIRHYVVWSRLPITHPGIVPTEIWERVVQDGLWGFSGSEYKPKGSGDKLIDQLVRQAGAEVRTYVENKWPAEEYEVAWFVNPPRLQSIPGLAHLHVFARKKSD
ncbi:phosphopantothenoylcysteine decarboxylase [Rhizoctonia solani AG-3 Rhs1AP]|uniref:Phosphopantothenoylcysteine decarboxylase n=1 Tax=Rhizoctonia solani AG-3 Rhs1AP TaxID=1086054 RepID=X8IZ77_9AGAM|nr:phosphopantothenoylcysteine decarboxylase [Rhizoctonia solani AG-3 Rhs1AP]